MVARCAVEGLDINRWMVTHGQAVAVQNTRSTKSLTRTSPDREGRAWAGEFQDPADFRHQKRDGQGSAPPEHTARRTCQRIHFGLSGKPSQVVRRNQARLTELRADLLRLVARPIPPAAILRPVCELPAEPAIKADTSIEHIGSPAASMGPEAPALAWDGRQDSGLTGAELAGVSLFFPCIYRRNGVPRYVCSTCSSFMTLSCALTPRISSRICRRSVIAVVVYRPCL